MAHPSRSPSLRALHLAHLRVDLRLAEPSFAASLRQASENARAIGVALEVALYLGERAVEQLQALRAIAGVVRPPIATWIVHRVGAAATAGHWVELARGILGDYAPTALFGAGTDANFTELNQYHVVLEVQQKLQMNPDALKKVLANDLARLEPIVKRTGASLD